MRLRWKRLLPLLLAGVVIWSVRPAGPDAIAVRLPAPPQFLGGKSVEFVGVFFWSGYGVNAMPDGRAELRCTRWPWLRVTRHDFPPPEGWTRETRAEWGREQVTVFPEYGGPLHFTQSETAWLRWCP